MPMLMVPSSESIGKRNLYSISEQKLYNNFEFCNSSKRCCGSTSNAPGWLVTVDPLGEREFSITLVNVFKREVPPIRLPPLHSSVILTPKVILSADPVENQDSYVVVAVNDKDWKLAFIKGGETSWTWLQGTSFFTDAIFYKRKVYTVGQPGIIMWSDIIRNPVEQYLLGGGINRFSGYAIKGYLVETTKGDLLHVRRFSKEKKDVPRGGYYCHYESWEYLTESFKVYKVVFDESEDTIVDQIELESIGDEAIFVGDNYSMCVSASNFPGCQANSIYYTDDLVELRQVRMLEDGSVAWHDIESLSKVKDETMTTGPSDGSITQHYSLTPWHKNIPPAIWSSHCSISNLFHNRVA